jgi:hypothetical protein
MAELIRAEERSKLESVNEQRGEDEAEGRGAGVAVEVVPDYTGVVVRRDASRTGLMPT